MTALMSPSLIAQKQKALVAKDTDRMNTMGCEGIGGGIKVQHCVEARRMSKGYLPVNMR